MAEQVGQGTQSEQIAVSSGALAATEGQGVIIQTVVPHIANGPAATGGKEMDANRIKWKFYYYLKGPEENTARIFNRRLLSFNALSVLIAHWSMRYEWAQPTHDVERHATTLADASAQLAWLGFRANVLWGEDHWDFGRKWHSHYHCLSPSWCLFYPLAIEKWPDNPAIPPFAAVGATGLASPVPLKELEVDGPYGHRMFTREDDMFVPQGFTVSGGWKRLKPFAGRVHLRVDPITGCIEQRKLKPCKPLPKVVLKVSS
jgi:hypothetical protein